VPVAAVRLICSNLDNSIACTWQLDRLMRDRRRGLESDLGVRNAWRVGPTEDYQLQWVLVEEAQFYLSLDAVKGVKKRGSLGRRWSAGCDRLACRLLALPSLLPRAHAAR
jgi:hypothetical protein